MSNIEIKELKKWEDARKYLYEMKSLYEEIGWVAVFGLSIINTLVVRYENGERSRDLYDEIMSLE